MSWKLLQTITKSSLQYWNGQRFYFFSWSNKIIGCLPTQPSADFPEFTLSMLSSQLTAPQGSALSSSTIIPIITKNNKNVTFHFIYYCWNTRHLLHIPPSNKHGSCVASQLCSAWTSSEAWRVEDRGHSYVCRHWAIEKGYHWGMGRAVGCMRRGANSALLWALPG